MGKVLGPGDVTGGCREGLGRSFLGWLTNLRCELGLGMQLSWGVLTVDLGDCCFEGWDVEMVRPYVFPCPAIAFA